LLVHSRFFAGILDAGGFEGFQAGHGGLSMDWGPRLCHDHRILSLLRLLLIAEFEGRTMIHGDIPPLFSPIPPWSSPIWFTLHRRTA
jgi:hypothetical protein